MKGKIPFVSSVVLFLILSINGVSAQVTQDWNISYDLGATDYATEMVTDLSGNVVVIGFAGGSGNTHLRIFKLTSDGNELWNKTIDPTGGNDGANGVAVANDGDYIVSGYDSLGNALVYKLDKDDGSIVWNISSNPSTGSDFLKGVAIGNDGDIITVGNAKNGTKDMWYLEKINVTNGNQIWNITEDPSTENDRAEDVKVDNDGNYVIVGTQYFAVNSLGWRIEKRNSSDGSLIWNKTDALSSTPFDEARGVIVDSDNNYVICGWENTQMRVEKRSPSNGDLIWNFTRTYDSGGKDCALDTDGKYLIGGWKKDGSYKDWYVEKVDKDGNLEWNFTLDWYSDKNDEINGITSGSVYMAGMTNTNLEWGVAKYSEIGEERLSIFDQLPSITGALVVTTGFGIIGLFAVLTFLAMVTETTIYEPRNFIRMVIGVVIIISILAGVFVAITL